MNNRSSYKDLIVWQKAIDTTKLTYQLTKSFPKDELYALTNQMRRCAVSIPSNIAEGKCRGSRKDFAHFLRIAFSSGAELQTQLEISQQLQYGKLAEYKEVNAKLEEVCKMLSKMIQTLSAPAH